MKKMVPLEKMSKKERRKYHLQQRGSWYGLSPVSRTVPNGKAYSRAAEKIKTRSITGNSGRHGAGFWL